MSKLLRKPSQEQGLDVNGKFEKFNLKENPFPSEPTVNQDSEDKRINGDIFEIEIRKKEYEHIKDNFLKQPQTDLNHIRLGYIIDTSYIGRGNGKSAFLVNLLQDINKDYCMDVSNNLNKCFAIYVSPEPGGRTKTFPSFVDLLFSSILRQNIIKVCLATLRLEAISAVHSEKKIDVKDDSLLIGLLNSKDWYEGQGYDNDKVMQHIYSNKYLQDLPDTFPLFEGRNGFLKPFISQDDFENYYFKVLKKNNKDRLDFVFSHLIRLFQAASFNGGYVLVDDFERIPDFQSSRQKKDFALELRSCLFDGLYTNAKIGFYTLLLVLHAGVPRLISDAWAESGMENRSPISLLTDSKHILPFEKLNKEHASLLLIKYLSEYRIKKPSNKLFPFTEDALAKIGEMAEYNAAKILKIAYNLLDKAATIDGQIKIDSKFVAANKGIHDELASKGIPSIETAASTDLNIKARD